MACPGHFFSWGAIPVRERKFTPRRLCLLAIAALLFSSHAALAQFTQQGSKLVGSGGVSNAHQGGAVSLSSDGNTLITGGIVENGGEGAAWIFTRTGVTWNQQGSKLVGTGASGAAQQGQSVALSGDGNTALVGGWWDNSFVGAAWVFVRSGNTWSQQGAKLVANDGIDQSSQGASVALSEDGNTAIVGGYSDDNSLGGASYKGAAWIYTRSGTTWTQQAKLTANDGSGGSRLGQSVSLSADGNTALVGGYQDNGGDGAAWVFTRSGNTWTQQGNKLVGTGGNFSNQGVSVALSADGTTAVIGGSVDSNATVLTGAVWVFTRSGNTWSQQGSKLIGTGATGDSEQGAAVAVSADGNTLLSGGIIDDTQIGATWVFTRSAGVWSQFNSKLVGNDVQNSPEQGFGVALSGNGRTAVVGGPLDHNSIGATWVYAQPVLPATVTLGSSDSSSVFGQSVTFTATVTAGASGEVDFKRDSTILGTVALSSGTAQFTTSGLPVGSGTITAIYAGDAVYDPATSSGLTQTVGKGATTTTLSVSPATSSPGQTILFKATIHVTAPAAGSPSGTVTFKDGSTRLGTGSVSSGHATLSKAGLTIGSHKITAIYSGDANFAASSFTGNSHTGIATVSAKLGATEPRGNTHTAGSQQFPAIAKLKSGYFVAWASNGQDGSLYGVYGQRYTAAGAKTGAELHISTRTAGNQTAPKVAGLKAGGFVTVWQSDAQDGSLSGIYAQNFSATGGKVGAEFRVNTTTAGAQTQPAIAALSGGGFVVAWTSNGQDKSSLGVYAQRYDAAAKAVGSEFLVNTRTTGAQFAPTIAALTDGGFAVAWESAGQDASGLGVYAQRYTSTGVKSGAEFRVNTTTVGDQSLPAAAGLSDGGFVIAWQSNLQDGSGLGVYAQRFRSTGVKNGGETRTNTMTVNDQWQPQVSAFGDGGFVVVWSSKGQDGSGQGVYAQAHKSTGVKANVEFLINTTTLNDQWQPGVAAGVAGEFMAAWTSKGQDGSLEGVFTQRFKVPVAP
jgi:hypothetical protein